MLGKGRDGKAGTMIRWVWELLWPPHCEHDWEHLARAEIRAIGAEYPVATRDTYRCKKCGKSMVYKL
jgi:hypothetical protein